MSDELPDLLARARDVAANAHCPYSGFAVGAAVRFADGDVTVGTNVENGSYGLTICAERSAVVAGVAARGTRAIEAVAVWVEADSPATPCGACLQVLEEFRPGDASVELLLGCPEGWEASTLEAHLPKPFRFTTGE